VRARDGSQEGLRYAREPAEDVNRWGESEPNRRCDGAVVGQYRRIPGTIFGFLKNYWTTIVLDTAYLEMWRRSRS